MTTKIEAISPLGYKVQIELFPFEAEIESALKQLAAAELALQEAGFEPSVEPPRTPDGLPICRKHGTPMRRREKQGDAWYSHVVEVEGQELWCKGRAGKDSPGWEF